VKRLPLLVVFAIGAAVAQQQPVVLHAARLLDVETGKLMTPGEILVQGERIVEAGASVTHGGNSSAFVKHALKRLQHERASS